MPHQQIKVVPRHTGRKVSEVLMEFAEPWLEEAINDEQSRTVVSMAVLAWNMAGIPEPERWDRMSLEFASKLGEPGKAILKEMIARKLAVYADENHTLLDFAITGEGDNMRVDVVYSLSPEEARHFKTGL
jgi:hypothetical protein